VIIFHCLIARFRLYDAIMVRIIDISPARDKLERKKNVESFAHRNARGQREYSLDYRTLFRRLNTRGACAAWHITHPGKCRTLTLACKSYLRKARKSVEGVKPR